MTVTINDNSRNTVTGLILAGGQAQRMGGVDKGLLQLCERPLIEWVLDALQPQVASLIINANRSHADYRHYGHAIVADELDGYCGPLAGIAAGLGACTTDYLVVTPCDSPLLPMDLVQRLQEHLRRDTADIAVAHSGDRLQPVFALLHARLISSLQAFLDTGGRKIDQWYAQHKITIVGFSDAPDMFLNINTPEDLAALEARLLAASA